MHSGIGKLFSEHVAGDDLDPGYVNLRIAESRIEQRTARALEHMWLQYEPYADADFKSAFARDLESRYWEMALGCALLDAGRTLLRREERPRRGGQPDICILDEGRRIWIEAIAPTVGEVPRDRIPEIVPINQGGRVARRPTREIQLRITSAFFNKSRALETYIDSGVIASNDVRIIAIGAAHFGIYAAGTDFPLALSALFPIGDQYFILDGENFEISHAGYYRSDVIHRDSGDIPRTAFLDEQFRHISAVIWSRLSVGNMHRSERPISLIHNPLALVPMPQNWGVWDKEFLGNQDEEGYSVTDVLDR